MAAWGAALGAWGLWLSRRPASALERAVRANPFYWRRTPEKTTHRVARLRQGYLAFACVMFAFGLTSLGFFVRSAF